MKYALLVMACLAQNPTECKEYMTILPEITNATACHLAGQMELRSWIRSHLDHKVTDAYCLSVPTDRTVTAALEEGRHSPK